MKNFKKYGFFVIGFLLSTLLVGCSCSDDSVRPGSIMILIDEDSSINEKVMFIDEQLDLSYVVNPDNADDVYVSVSFSEQGYLSVDKTIMAGSVGLTTLYAKQVNEQGVEVTFSVNGSELFDSITIYIYDTPTELDAPTDVVYNEQGYITFNGVQGQTDYFVNLNGNQYQVYSEEYQNIKFELPADDLLFNQTNSVMIAVDGDDLYFADSVYTEYEFVVLNQVSNLSADNGYLTWEANELATSYVVEVNGVSYKTDQSNFKITTDNNIDYEISVYACPNEANSNYFKSFGAEIELTHLQQPDLQIVNYDVDGNALSTPYIEITQVKGATSYQVDVYSGSVGGTRVKSFSTQDTYVLIDSSYSVDTQYYFAIKAIGDNSATIAGDTSAIKVTKLGQVSNVDIVDNVLSFTALSDATAYAINFVNGTTFVIDKTIIIQSTSLNLKNDFDLSGDYDIQIQAIGGNNFVNGDTLETNKSFTKYADVSVTNISNQGVITFSEVADASSYLVYLNDQMGVEVYTSTYQLTDSEILVAQSNYIYVVAVGNGVDTITSDKENSKKEFWKLDAVDQSTYSITNNVLMFDGVQYASNYQVSINNGEYVLTGNITDGKQSYTIPASYTGDVLISIQAVGGNNVINSNAIELQVASVVEVTNLTVTYGVLTWDAVTNANYYVYVNNNEAVLVTTNSFSSFSSGSGVMEVSVVATPKEGYSFLNSAKSTINIDTLSAVDVNTIKIQNADDVAVDSNQERTQVLTWDSVENADKYLVKIYIDEIYFTSYYTDTNSFEFKTVLASGNHTISVTAIGSTNSTQTHYVSSAEVVTSITVLEKIGKIEFSYGVITWEQQGDITPTGYLIQFVCGELVTYAYTTATTYALDPQSFDDTIIDISIKAVSGGLYVNSAYSDSYYCEQLADILSLQVTNSQIIVEHDLASVDFDVYIKLSSEIAYSLANSSFVKISDGKYSITIDDIIAGQAYDIYVVAKNQSYLQSNNSDSVSVTQINQVTNLVVDSSIDELTGASSNWLTWDSVSGATVYKVELLDSNGDVKFADVTNQTTYTIDVSIAGSYAYNVYAVAEQDGYLTSSANQIVVTMLDAVSGILIENNVLTIMYDGDVTPLGYTISITDSAGKTFYQRITSNQFDLASDSYATGNLSIVVYTLGDNSKNIIASASPLSVTVSKFDSDSLGLSVADGKITWTQLDNGYVDIYVDGELYKENLATNSIDLMQLVVGVSYEISIVGKPTNDVYGSQSQSLTVGVLPMATNFNIVQYTEQSLTGETSYRLVWDNVIDVDSALFEYEITARTMFGTIDTFNGIVDSQLNYLDLNLSSLTDGDIYFNIRVKSISGTMLSSDYLVNELHVNVLKAIEISGYDSTTNSILFTNDNYNATKVIVTYVSDEIVYSTELASNATSYVIDHPETLPSGNYRIYINAIGDINNNILTNNSIASEVYTILQTPTSFSVVNGYLNWNNLDDVDVRYDLYIDGVYFETYTSSAQAKLLNEQLTDFSSHIVKIVATKDGAISSGFTDEITVSKTQLITDAKMSNYQLTWSSVAGASAYVVKWFNTILDSSMQSSIYYDATFDGLFTFGTSLMLPDNMPVGGYYFTVMPVGSLMSTSRAYLTGSEGNDINVVVIQNIDALNIVEGKLSWSTVANSMMYRVTISQDESVVLDTYINNNAYDFATNLLSSGYYTVRVSAYGDGSKTFNASIDDAKTIEVYKSFAVQNYKIIDGYLSWEVDLNDQFFVDFFDDFFAGYDSSSIDQAKDAFIDEELNEVGFNTSFDFIKTIELTVNGEIYSGNAFDFYDYSSSENKIVFYHNFKGDSNTTYTISARMQGVDWVYVEPEEDEDWEDSAILVVSGEWSSTVSGYKLISPVSPVGANTMIENNNLHFGKLGTVYGDENIYVITAQPVVGGPSSKMIINNQNESSYLTQTSSGSIQSYMYQVPASEFLPEAGVEYNVTVSLQGTADSELNDGTNYFTSTATNAIVCTKLASIEIDVVEGDISIVETINANGYELRIWNAEYGETWDNSWLYQDGKDAKQISFNKENYADIEFLTYAGGFTYTLTNNDNFEFGQSYYVSAAAVGDGVNAVTSSHSKLVNDNKNTVKITKTGAMIDDNAIGMKGGMFTWKQVEFELNDEVYNPDAYKVSIYRYVTGYPEAAMMIGSSKQDVNTLRLSNGYLSYDLPAKYEYSSDGNVYEYYIEVSAYGQGSEEELDGNIWFVNGDSGLSDAYQRISNVSNVTFSNGVITWDALSDGVYYDVYFYDESIGDYTLTNDGENNSYIFTFSADKLQSGEIFEIRIRVSVGEENTTYLNGGYCVSLLLSKLVEPDLRIEEGVVKWNNTDTSVAIGDTKVLITSLDDGTIIYKDDLVKATDSINSDQGFILSSHNSDLFASVDAGKYSVEVGYIGTANGSASNSNENMLYSFSSDYAYVEVEKLATPQATVYNEGTKTYIITPLIDNAVYYEFTAVKYSGNNIILENTFDTYKINIYNQYVEIKNIDGVDYVSFDIQAVADYDNGKLLAYQFGNSYVIYAEAYAENVSTDDIEYRDNIYLLLQELVKSEDKQDFDDLEKYFGTTMLNELFDYYETNKNLNYYINTFYIKSNRSVELMIEDPTTPTDIVIDTEIATITWSNSSELYYTRLYIDYTDRDDVVVELQPGVNTYTLTVMGNYTIKLQAYVLSEEGVEFVSDYTSNQSVSLALYLSGAGTEQEPYVISNPYHLSNVYLFTDASFVLNNDITANTITNDTSFNGYLIGDSATVFTGVFDGNGKTISDIYFDNSHNVVTFVNQLSSTGVIKDLVLQYVGGDIVASKFAGVTINNYGVIQNVVTSSAELVYNSASVIEYAGLAVNNMGTISNCINNISFVKSSSHTMAAYVGGITYQNFETITQCGNNAELQGSLVGGITAYHYGSITECFNKGNICAYSSISSASYAGGLVAWMKSATYTDEQGATISTTLVLNNSYVNISEFNISTSATAICGGLVGIIDSGVTQSIEYCYVAVQAVNNDGKIFGIITGSDTRTSNDNLYQNRYNTVYYLNSMTGNVVANQSSSNATLSGKVTGYSTSEINSYMSKTKFSSQAGNNGLIILIWEE